MNIFGTILVKCAPVILTQLANLLMQYVFADRIVKEISYINVNN